MVIYDPQEFGGMEELAASVSITLCQQNHRASLLSFTWVPPENQYVHRLREHGVPYVQIPKILSYLASHWATKEWILRRVMVLLTPFVFILALNQIIWRRSSWKVSYEKSFNWLRGRILSRLIAPDRRKSIGRWLLEWWHFWWRPEILHIHSFQSSTSDLLFVLDWARARRIPVVYHEHQTPEGCLELWEDFRREINKSAVVLAVSQKSAQALMSLCGVTRPIQVVNPLLQDPARAITYFMPAPIAGREREISITAIARLDEVKGLEYLLEAIAQVVKKHPEIRLRVYGDGPLRQQLIIRSRQLGLEGETIFAGVFKRREELVTIMAHTDIFVISSLNEGQPVSLIEAMAYGVPIVSTAVGGIPELITDGVNGLLCVPKDPHCLAEKIFTLIEDQDLRVRLGIAARRSFEQGQFTPEAITRQFISIYRQVVDQP